MTPKRPEEIRYVWVRAGISSFCFSNRYKTGSEIFEIFLNLPILLEFMRCCYYVYKSKNISFYLHCFWCQFYFLLIALDLASVVISCNFQRKNISVLKVLKVRGTMLWIDLCMIIGKKYLIIVENRKGEETHIRSYFERLCQLLIYAYRYKMFWQFWLILLNTIVMRDLLQPPSWLNQEQQQNKWSM